jgi:hypothetical protein
VKKKSKKYYMYLKKKSALVHLKVNIEEIDGMLMSSKLIVDERKIQ